jgi:hypothetical protein
LGKKRDRKIKYKNVRKRRNRGKEGKREKQT